MPLILGAQSAVSTGYSIDNSCRFNSASSAQLKRTAGTATDPEKYTFSCWVKRGSFPATNMQLIACEPNASEREWLFFVDTNQWLKYMGHISPTASKNIITTQRFRDVAAWCHVVLIFDSAQAVAANRTKLYVNGTQITNLAGDSSTAAYVIQNADSPLNTSGNVFCVGANWNYHSGGYAEGFYNGYMAEVFFCDGQALTPSSFGEFNEDSPTIWQPIDCSGDLTFGDNGFYLNFSDSADLGADSSGNSNDFALTNIAAVDQCEDSPTNNFTTLNPLNVPASNAPTFSEGATYVVTPNAASSYFGGTTTLGLSSGKWYWETYSVSALAAAVVGVYTNPGDAAYNSRQPGYSTYDWAYEYDGTIISNNVDQDTGMGSWSSGDYIGTYLDLDNNKIYWALNGTIINSGTGWDITAAASTTHGFYYPGCADQETTASTFAFNFGNGSFGNINLTGTVYADNDGYGIFKYSPNDGGSASFDSAAKNFMAICTKNLGKYGG